MTTSTPIDKANQPFMQIIGLTEVSTSLFGRLESGKLSCFVVPASLFTKNEAGISFRETGADGKATGRKLDLMVTASADATQCFALQAGFKVISLAQPAVHDGKAKGLTQQEISVISSDVKATFANLGSRNPSYIAVEGSTELKIGDVIGITTGGRVAKHPITDMLRSQDVAGIRPEAVLLSLPQAKPQAQPAKPGWA